MLFKTIDPRRYAAMRILFGLLTLMTLIDYFGELSFYYSDEGWLPLKTAIGYTADREWTLLHTFTTPTAVRAFYALTVGASVSLTLGFRSRAAAWICFVGLASFHSRNWMNTYGGDVVLRLMLFLLAWSRCGAAWSLDRWLYADPSRAPAPAPVWPLRLMQFQVMAIYLSTGLAKLHGGDWVSGNAIGMMLLNPNFARWDWTTRLTWAPIRLTFKTTTLVTLAWELAFPALIVFRQSRLAALALGVLLHLGITLFVQVHWFGAIMISTYLAFVPESWFDLRASWPALRGFARARSR